LAGSAFAGSTVEDAGNAVSEDDDEPVADATGGTDKSAAEDDTEELAVGADESASEDGTGALAVGTDESASEDGDVAVVSADAEGAAGVGAADVSQLHGVVSANGGLIGSPRVPLVVVSKCGSELAPFGAGSISPGVAVRVGAGVPVTAELTVACTSETTDVVSLKTARLSCSSAWMVRLNSALRSLVARRKSLIALPT
jgi:hypothetical protein